MAETDMHDRLSFYYDWASLSGTPEAFRAAVREFIDNGVRRFVITAELLRQMIRDPEKVKFLHRVCRELEVEFPSVHGMFGDDFDLNIPTAERRPEMFREHIRLRKQWMHCRTESFWNTATGLA